MSPMAMPRVSGCDLDEGEVAQPLLQADPDDGAQHGAGEVAHAAEDHEAQDEERLDELKLLGEM